MLNRNFKDYDFVKTIGIKHINSFNEMNVSLVHSSLLYIYPIHYRDMHIL